MKSAIRIFAIVLAGVLVLLGLLAAYLMFVFDPNDYRERIATEVERATGRSLVIDGDIGLSVFPWIGVEIDRVRLGNAQGFGDKPFAEIGEVEVRARLMPLLRSEVEVDRVVLRGLRLDLQRDAQGRSNWDDLAARGGGGETAKTPGGAAAGATAAIVVAGIEIADAQVAFADRQAGAEYLIDKLSLKSGEVRPGSRFPLEIGFDVATTAPKLTARVDLSGGVRFELQGPKADIENFSLRVDARGDSLPAGRAELVVGARLALDLAAGTLAVDGLSVKGYGVEARGALAGKGLDATPAISGTLEVAQADPRAILAALGAKAPDLKDGAALKRASLKTRIEASNTAAALRDLVVVLDDSTLSGEVAVADLAKQALRFDLALDAIDLDRYLPPPHAGDTPVSGKPSGDAGGAIDPAVLRGLDVIGKIKVGKLKVRGASVSDILVEVRAQGGVLRLSPLSAALYDGRYAGNVSVDGRGQTLAVSLDESLTGVQVGPLLKDLAGAEERLTGRTHLKARLQARGNDPEAMKRTLGGNVEFRFTDGAIKGINVAQYLRQAQARITGRPAPDANEPNQTDFTELSGTVQLADGIARNEDLDLRSPLLRVGGRGSANIPQETIDYVVRASVVATLSGQGGAGLDNLKGVTVPIKVSGTFASPSFGLDIESLITDRVKQQAQEKLKGAVQDKVAPQLQESLQKGLGGLLKR